MFQKDQEEKDVSDLKKPENEAEIKLIEISEEGLKEEKLKELSKE